MVENRITRRQLLKLMGTGALLVTLPGLAEEISYLKTSYIAGGRTEKPLLNEDLKPHKLILGISPDKNNADMGELNQMFRIINIFPEWESDWGIEIVREISTRHQIPMISIRPNDKSNTAFHFPDLNKYGSLIRKNARKIKKITGPVFVRFAYEMNGNWFPHSSSFNSPEDFKKGWKEFAEILKVEAPQAKLVFCPNVMAPIIPYIPDPKTFDIVALDGYDKHNPNLLNLRHFYPNLNFEELFGPDIRILQKLGIPIMIAEIGSARGEETALWLKNALAQAALCKDLFAVCIFAWNKQGQSIGEANWDITKNLAMMEILGAAGR